MMSWGASGSRDSCRRWHRQRSRGHRRARNSLVARWRSKVSRWGQIGMMSRQGRGGREAVGEPILQFGCGKPMFFCRCRLLVEKADQSCVRAPHLGWFQVQFLQFTRSIGEWERWRGPGKRGVWVSKVLHDLISQGNTNSGGQYGLHKSVKE
jgi:hypothetical protein